MLNASTRTVRGGASPVFDSAMRQNDGLNTGRVNVNPYAAEKKDKTGSHSIAALNRFICDSKNGATYSNNIKAAIGEKPDPVNPYIPCKYGKPLPDEKFTIRGKLANEGCGCTRKDEPLAIIPKRKEGFCGCEQAFVQHAPEILSYGPIVLIVLILCAALLVAKIAICRLTGKAAAPVANAVSFSKGMDGGVIDGDFDSII